MARANRRPKTREFSVFDTAKIFCDTLDVIDAMLIITLKNPSAFDKQWNKTHYGSEKGK